VKTIHIFFNNQEYIHWENMYPCPHRGPAISANIIGGKREKGRRDKGKGDVGEMCRKKRKKKPKRASME
jgi:hypothetical protein